MIKWEIEITFLHWELCQMSAPNQADLDVGLCALNLHLNYQYKQTGTLLTNFCLAFLIASDCSSFSLSSWNFLRLSYKHNKEIDENNR